MNTQKTPSESFPEQAEHATRVATDVRLMHPYQAERCLKAAANLMNASWESDYPERVLHPEILDQALRVVEMVAKGMKRYREQFRT